MVECGWHLEMLNQTGQVNDNLQAQVITTVSERKVGRRVYRFMLVPLHHVIAPVFGDIFTHGDTLGVGERSASSLVRRALSFQHNVILDGEEGDGTYAVTGLV